MDNIKFEIMQIDENSWYFDGAVGRAFLYRGKKKALLVDTTNGPGDLRGEVERLVGKLPIVLVNTHGDWDHIGCNGQFEYCYMNPAEFAYYATKCKPGDAIPLPLDDGEKIDIGGRIFEVIYMPGHTYGSIALLNREEKFLLGGDSILDYVFIFGPQRNLRALIYSLERLRDKYFDAFDIVYGAHFELVKDKKFILEEIDTAKDLLAKKIEGVEPPEIPLEAPDYKPAKMYIKGKAGFFDYAELPY